jgi:uncharacterized protein
MKIPATPLSQMLMFYGSIEHGVWTFDYKPADYIKNINTPTLFMWGAKDGRVSKNETDLLFENLSSKNKKLVIFSESGHVSYCKTEFENWKTHIDPFLK